MTDPRAENCRSYKLDAGGKVVGVNLVYQPIPSAKYELIQAKLIDEYEAGETLVATCSVLTKDGIVTAEKVWLAWAWPELVDGFGLPGNPNGQHIISNGYRAADGVIGPLALYPGDAQHNPIGDVIGGIGLPDNRHVCYLFTWRERGAVVVPPATVDLTAVMVSQAGIHSEQLRIHADLERLARHLGLVL